MLDKNLWELLLEERSISVQFTKPESLEEMIFKDINFQSYRLFVPMSSNSSIFKPLSLLFLKCRKFFILHLASRVGGASV